MPATTDKMKLSGLVQTLMVDQGYRGGVILMLDEADGVVHTHIGTAGITTGEGRSIGCDLIEFMAEIEREARTKD